MAPPGVFGCKRTLHLTTRSFRFRPDHFTIGGPPDGGRPQGPAIHPSLVRIQFSEKNRSVENNGDGDGEGGVSVYPRYNYFHKLERISFSITVCASGKVHERQRKILGPVFFASQLKSFIPIFQEASSKVSDLYLN